MKKLLALLILFTISACDMSPAALSGAKSKETPTSTLELMPLEPDAVYAGNCSSLTITIPALTPTESGTENEACRMPRYAVQSVGLTINGNKAGVYRIGLRPIPGTESKPKYAEIKELTLRDWNNGELLHFACPTAGEIDVANALKFVDCAYRDVEVTGPNGKPTEPPQISARTMALYKRKSEASGQYVPFKLQLKNPDCDATVTYTDSMADRMGHQSCDNGNPDVYGSDRRIDESMFGVLEALTTHDPN